MGGCRSADHVLDDTNFAKPLPLIGLYVAFASFVCAVLMSHDAVSGIRKRKFWFPCVRFPLNAFTLTILTVATKLPVDLNTPMPGRIDQLCKLTGTVLTCTAMANFLPSLGRMDRSALASNVCALAILVVTAVVNVSIQMRTGVIYAFWPEHILVAISMLVVLAIFAASALPVPTTKHLLDEEFDTRYESVLEQCKAEQDSLRKMVERYWLMAHTANPQYVMGRSATCIASGAFCFLGAMVVVEAYLRSHSHSSMLFCTGASDYGWSTKVVFYTQTAAIMVGSLAPAYRWLSAVAFGGVRTGSWRCWARDLTVEEYWIGELKKWMNKPPTFDNRSRRMRRLEHAVKTKVSVALIRLQRGVVVLSKLFRLLSVLPLSCLLSLARKLLRRMRLAESNGGGTSQRNLVLYLDGEDHMVDAIARSECRDVGRWIDKGRKEKPRALMQLISGRSQRGFEGVAALDRGRAVALVPPEHEPPDCWGLPIVTLTAIATALPDVDVAAAEKRRSLLEEVYQGLRYVRLIETYTESVGLCPARNSADALWKEIDLHGKWFGQVLHDPRPGESSCRAVVARLRELGRTRFVEFWKEESKEKEVRRHSKWPGEALAAYCMYRLASGIERDYERVVAVGKGDSYPYLPRTDENLHQWIRETIADLVCACLTNLPRVLYLMCVGISVGGMEEKVRDAALLLGEAEEEILPLVQEEEAEVGLDEQARVRVDEWVKRLGERRHPSMV